MRISIITIMILAIMTLTGCSASIKKTIIGKWQDTKNKKTIVEFCKDHSVVTDGVKGKWSFVNENKLKVDFNLMGHRSSEYFSVKIENDKLFVTSSDGKVTENIRLK